MKLSSCGVVAIAGEKWMFQFGSRVGFVQGEGSGEAHMDKSIVRRWKMVDREAADAAEADHGLSARRTNLRMS
ncbi:MAG TPA: hypothetical protein VGY56_14675 [Verrucomicrobiae bacterium]|nr:hypothetical protein [Verrucomicrobiae bacterium]